MSTFLRNSFLCTESGQRGAAAALLTLLVPVIIAVLGLVVDVGSLHARKRQAQTAADAAAVAAAHELRRNNVAGYRARAIEDAARNGFEPDDSTGIAINRPPTSGPVSGDQNFVEVVIEQEAPLLFMKMFGQDAATVQVRSVAGLVQRDVCTYILSDSGAASLSVRGGGSLDQVQCSIHVNSDHSSAAESTGVAEVVAAGVGVVGNYSGYGFYPTPEVESVALDDPFESLPAPAQGSCTHTSTVVVDDARTLYPGVYCGGIEVRAGGNATFASGEYIIDGGGLTVGGSCDPCSGGGSSAGGCSGDAASNAAINRINRIDRIDRIGRSIDLDRLASWFAPETAHADGSSGDSDSDSGSSGDSGSGGSSGGSGDSDSGSGEESACVPARAQGSEVMFFFTDSGCGDDNNGGNSNSGGSSGSSDSGSSGSSSGGGGNSGGTGSSAGGSGGSAAIRPGWFDGADSPMEAFAAAILPRVAHAGGSSAGSGSGRNCGGGGHAGLRVFEQAAVTLSAPNSGPRAGILLFDDPAISGGADHRLEDEASLDLRGAAYFRNRGLKVRDNVKVTWHTMTLAVDTLEISGSASIVEVDRNPSELAPAALAAALRE